MEARTAFRGSAISRSMGAVIAAVVAAFLLGALGGYAAKTLSLPVATSTAHVVAAQPAAAAGSDSVWNYSNRRGGPQMMEGPEPAQLPASASFRFREPATGRGGPQS
jgi:hypothetical protein